MKIVKVKSHHRKGYSVKGYYRKQLENRGKFESPKKEKKYKTLWKKSNSFFAGRERVAGEGDLTGIIREEKGRIIGRTKKTI